MKYFHLLLWGEMARVIKSATKEMKLTVMQNTKLDLANIL
jgi:hypothetical protein